MRRLWIAAIAALVALVQPCAAQLVGGTVSAVGGGAGQRFVYGPTPFGQPINGFFSPNASQLNETVDQWIPPLPGGGWMVFVNFALTTVNSGNPTATPHEQYPGNNNYIDYATVFTGQNGTGTATPCLFYDGSTSATLQSEGFAYLWVPPSPNGRWLRYSITTPVGGKRTQSRNFSYPAIGNGMGEVRKWKGASSTAEKTGGAISGTNIFGRAGFGGLYQILVPYNGQKSVLMLADSIGQQDDDRDWFTGILDWGMVGSIPRGLNSGTNGQVGFGNFTNHGAVTLDFMRTDSGYFAVRQAINVFARNKLNAGVMWPFTAIWSELGRNDFAPLALGTGNGGESALVAAMQARLTGWWLYLAVTYPGVPIIQGTITAKSNSTDQWTSLTGQTAREVGNSLDTVNAWILSRPIPLWLSVDSGATMRAANDGSGIPKWKLPALSTVGGGLVTSAVTTATSATTTGVTITATAAPEAGTYLVLEPGTANAEVLSIRAVADNGGGSYTVYGLGNAVGASLTFTKAHATGVPVKSAYTIDGLHPSSAMQRLMAAPVVAAKTDALLAP